MGALLAEREAIKARLAADPFETLTALPRAADLIDNRRAMQLLPAAREALNRWLLTMGGG